MATIGNFTKSGDRYTGGAGAQVEEIPFSTSSRKERALRFS